MNYSQAVEYMLSLRVQGIRPGLSGMADAADRLGHPEQAFRCVHIAGTNGKGSTAAMLSAALVANGHSVGCFTSPVVTDIGDTIQINGHPLSEDAFAAAATEVCALMPEGLTEFEWLTTVCFVCFRNAGIEIAVVECGLGGKQDATNILPAPLCAVFTPIDTDHVGILGDTIDAIAREKSGIIKPGCDVVCAPSMVPEALGVLYEAAASAGCRLWQPAQADLTVNGRPFSPAMTGSHQLDNARTVYMTLERLQAAGVTIDMTTALTAMESVTLPCRQEFIGQDPPVLLDGAHNPHGIRALCHTLKGRPGVTLIIGMLADKDHESVLSALAPYCRRIICCTPPDTPRPSMPAKQLQEIADRFHKNVEAIDDPVAAFETATADPEARLIAVGGSFYTASAVRFHLQTQP